MGILLFPRKGVDDCKATARNSSMPQKCFHRVADADAEDPARV